MLVYLLLGIAILNNHGSIAVRNSLHLPPPNMVLKEPYPSFWLDQKLDHFDPTNGQTWKQRYQINETHYTNKSGLPVFLLIGGEGPMAGEWMVEGAWLDYAKKYEAICFQLEHRYYGSSRPTKDLSTTNLKYLSSEQALADLAYFIEKMNEKYGLDESNKWVAFGGSYSGSLAAWLRYKYPHLVHAAISTSGPLLAKLDFKEYNEVLADSLSTYSNDCVASVKFATVHFDKLVKDNAGAQILKSKFKLCSKIDTDNKNDVYNLASMLSDNFAGVVQYNKDKRLSHSPTSNITIDDICEIMIDRREGGPLERYAAVNTLMMNLTETPCLDHTYETAMNPLRNISWENENAAGRSWTYQTCTEFGFYQTSSSRGIFGNNIPLKYFTQQCADAYGPEFTEDGIINGIKRTNMIYGELHLQASRVLYVHGSIDPWHALGITQTISMQSPAIYIDGTAHCANMYPPSPDDSEELVKARVKISNHIGAWLSHES